MNLAEQHGSESWDVLQACLEAVLPLPAAEATLCRDTVSHVSHTAVIGQSNGVSPPAEVSVEVVRVSQR